MTMNLVRGGLTAALVTAALVTGPGEAVGEAGCPWTATVLPVPPELAVGGVNAADGDGWFAGWGAARGAAPFDPTPVVRWHRGAAESLGLALGRPTTVYGVSPTGTVVGAVLDRNGQMSAVAYRGGAWVTLPRSGTSAWAYDVNAGGDVVGYDVIEDPENPENRLDRLVVWPGNESGSPTILPPPVGAERSSQQPRIDDDGTVVATYGRFVAPTVTNEGYVWRPGAQTPTRLTPLSPGESVTVTDIRGGHIVGVSRGTAATGVEWDVNGRIVRKFDGRAAAVNRDGFVLGTVADGSPVVWAPDGMAPQPLPTPAGYTSAYPRAIGDQAIGGHAASGSTSVPVIWRSIC